MTCVWWAGSFTVFLKNAEILYTTTSTDNTLNLDPISTKWESIIDNSSLSPFHGVQNMPISYFIKVAQTVLFIVSAKKNTRSHFQSQILINILSAFWKQNLTSS